MLGIILVVGVAILIAGCKYFSKDHPDHILDGPGMVNEVKGFEYFEYSVSGDDIGSSYDLEIVLTDQGKAKITLTTCKGNGYEDETITTTTQDSFVDEINQLMAKGKMDQWTDLEKSDIFVLDGPSTYIQYQYNTVDITLEDQDILPEGGYEIIRQIRELAEKQFELDK